MVPPIARKSDCLSAKTNLDAYTSWNVYATLTTPPQVGNQLPQRQHTRGQTPRKGKDLGPVIQLILMAKDVPQYRTIPQEQPYPSSSQGHPQHLLRNPETSLSPLPTLGESLHRFHHHLPNAKGTTKSRNLGLSFQDAVPDTCNEKANMKEVTRMYIDNIRKPPVLPEAIISDRGP